MLTDGHIGRQKWSKRPTTLHFNSDGTLLFADQSTQSALQARLVFNGIDIRAYPTKYWLPYTDPVAQNVALCCFILYGEWRNVMLQANYLQR